MKVRDFLKTHTKVYKATTFETVPVRYVVTFHIPKALFEARGMEPDRAQRVHGFGTKKEADAHARLMKRQGGYRVRVLEVKQTRQGER